MDVVSLQTIYRSVVIAKLTYASSARTPMRICLLPSPATFIMFYIISYHLSLEGLNTTIYVNNLRPPFSNWTSHRQELHAAHAVLELILGIRLINSIILFLFIVLCSRSFLYSRCVLSAFLINEYCIISLLVIGQKMPDLVIYDVTVQTVIDN